MATRRPPLALPLARALSAGSAPASAPHAIPSGRPWCNLQGSCDPSPAPGDHVGDEAAQQAFGELIEAAACN